MPKTKLLLVEEGEFLAAYIGDYGKSDVMVGAIALAIVRAHPKTKKKFIKLLRKAVTQRMGELPEVWAVNDTMRPLVTEPPKVLDDDAKIQDIVG
jgi:hypothetical protein